MAQKRNSSTGLIMAASLVGGAFLFFRKKQALQNLDYNIAGVKFSKIDNIFEALLLKIKVIVEINNPSSTTLGFKSFVGNLIYNNNAIGNFKLYDPIDIKPQATTRIEVPVTVSAISVLTEIIKALTSGLKKSVTVQGLLKVASLEVPVNQTVNFVQDGK